jgi:hypothetical protein
MIGGPMFPTLDNQWGDGAWIFWLFDRKSLTQFEIYDEIGLTIPREGVNTDAMQREFFRTLMDPKAFDADGLSQDR